MAHKLSILAASLLSQSDATVYYVVDKQQSHLMRQIDAKLGTSLKIRVNRDTKGHMGKRIAKP